MIVIDASTVISSALGDENDLAADAAIDYIAENGAVVPGNFFSEVVNALARAERRKRIDAVKADIALTEILELPLSIEAADPHTVLEVTRSYRLTAYDASYIALALQSGLSLATVDRVLGAAATAAKCRWRP